MSIRVIFAGNAVDFPVAGGVGIPRTSEESKTHLRRNARLGAKWCPVPFYPFKRLNTRPNSAPEPTAASGLRSFAVPSSLRSSASAQRDRWADRRGDAMTQRFALPTVLALVGCATFSACGITGGTSRFVLPLDSSQRPKITSEIRVASAGMDVNPAYLTAVNVFRWGKFDAADLQNLEESLRGTIPPHLPTTSRSIESRIDIHLVIRRYVVSVSNNAGAVLACVAWAATTSQGRLIFEEQFFASHVAYFVATIGLIKDEVHRAIVGRIATTAMTLAADPTASLRPMTFENTSTSLDEAASRLPRTMASMGVPLGPSPIGLVGVLIPTGLSTVQWEVAKPSEGFDWQGYLEKLHTTR